jgi:ATP-binding cassette, subfamily B, bacterial PglK
MSLVRKLVQLIVHDRRAVVPLAGMLAGMLVAAVLEAAGVGLIMPFIAVIDRPEIVDHSRPLRWLRAAAHLGSSREVVVFVGLLLAGTFVVKNAYLAWFQRAQFRFIFANQVALGRRLVAAYLHAPYTLHLQRNSAELLRVVNTDIPTVFNHVVVSAFVLVVEGVSVLVVAALVVAYEPVLVPAIGLVAGGFGWGFYRAIRHELTRLGREQLVDQAAMIQAVGQGLGGLKEARVLGREGYFVAAYDRHSQRFGRAMAHHRFVGLLPRYALETLGMLGLVGFALTVLALGRDPRTVLPSLGLLAVATVRLLPSLARVMGAIAEIRAYGPAVEAVHADLGLPVDAVRAAAPVAPLALAREVGLVDVEYTYPGAARPSLRGVTCTVHRGEAIAFVGSSGAGKTTLVDVLIGLLTPTRGVLEVDGVPIAGATLAAWQRGIGYIPQQVYLSDDSIRRNVAFGVEDGAIDEARVRRAIAAAQLTELVAALPAGLDTPVGERGVRLSGGQRQRIGIARALYHEPQLLVLDEATAALDPVTEREVVEAIEKLRGAQTVVVVAHRLSTVRSCDRIVLLKDGQVAQVGTWDELSATNPDFQRMVRGARRDEPAVAAADG